MLTVLKSEKAKKIIRSCLMTAAALALLGVLSVLGINLFVKSSVKANILTQEQAAQLQDIDCIIVLGCQVRSDGTPSHMLEDRLRRGVALYELGAAPKLLMSGDHGNVNYDEVDAMKHYAVDADIPSRDVFMDHAGFSTYETMARAKDVFQAKKVLIVTQTYHLYRAMYIAEQFGMEAYGVAAEYREYSGQFNRDIREVLARVKDFGMCVFKPAPTYLGEAIPISGNGEQTHDDKSNFT